jgi:chromosome segregation ATPase
MSITGRLTRKLYETLGEDAANEMVDWMHRVDSQRAELRDLNELNFSRTEARFAEMNGRLEEIEARLEKVEARLDRLEPHLGDMEHRLGAGLADVRRDLETGLARLEMTIERRTADIMKWSFGFWVGSVLAIAGALVVLSRFIA